MPRPTSTHEQRETVRLLALAVGVREAARQLNLSEDRVMQWSARYNWFPNGKTIVPLPTKGDCQQTVSKAADVLANYSQNTKFSLAKAADKAAVRIAEYEPDRIIGQSKALVNLAGASSKIHSWDNGTGTGTVALNVLSGGRALVQIKQ